MEKMKAIVCTKYGPPEVLQLRDLEKPTPKNNEVLIKIHATAVTASDCIIRKFKIPVKRWFPMGMFMEFMMAFVVGFKKPKRSVIGLVLSGEIESIGKDVQRFKVGDEVYSFTGYSFGAYAEYKCQSEKDSTYGCLALKPTNMSHEEAAAVAYGGILATHFVKKGNIQNGQKVLIYGASGAIGTMAVQLSKYFGAEVTGVCSSANFELVKSLGADKIIDYTEEDAVSKLEVYDLVFDAVGEIKSSELKEKGKKALSRNGKYISVDHGNPKLNSEHLMFIKELVEAGHVKAIIDRTYPLEEIVEAHRYVDGLHKKGNVVVTVQS